MTHCFLLIGSGGPESIYLLFYVDDILPTYHDKSEIEFVKSKLKSKFEMKYLGQAKRISRMKIERDKNNCIPSLNLRTYMKKILEKFSILECKPVSQSLTNHFKLSSD